MLWRVCYSLTHPPTYPRAITFLNKNPPSTAVHSTARPPGPYPHHHQCSPKYHSCPWYFRSSSTGPRTWTTNSLPHCPNQRPHRSASPAAVGPVLRWPIPGSNPLVHRRPAAAASCSTAPAAASASWPRCSTGPQRHLRYSSCRRAVEAKRKMDEQHC